MIMIMMMMIPQYLHSFSCDMRQSCELTEWRIKGRVKETKLNFLIYIKSSL